jgi:hypothetical protein
MSSFMKKTQGLWKSMVEYFSCRRIWIHLLIGAVVLLALVYVRFAFISSIDHDEVEHAHVGFKLLNGKIPYRDFYQNHLPAYWLLSMQFVRAFPFSTHAILAGRGVSLLALVGCWLLGFRLLGSIRGGRTWLGLSIYTCAMITLACNMDFHQARPDPVMALIGTAGLCLIPARGNISNARALLLGMLFGLSVSVSIKMVPIVLVVPALIVVHCIRDRRLQPATALFPYVLGMLLGLLPTVWWLFHNGLIEAFNLDVFGLNRALSKPWILSLNFLRIPIYVVSVLGTLLQLGTYERRLNRYANGPLVLALALAAGIALAFLARHPARYNLQILTIPIVIGFVSFVLRMCLLMRGPGCQWLLCVALLGYPALHVSSSLLNLSIEGMAIPRHELQRLMDLAKPGNRTCIAFSPAHPVFCHDISGLSNGWDISFAERIRNPRQIERFRKLWRDGIRLTIDQQPDIILRRSPQHFWERAMHAGLILPDELNALDALRSAYEIKHIGMQEVWIRRSK